VEGSILSPGVWKYVIPPTCGGLSYHDLLAIPYIWQFGGNLRHFWDPQANGQWEVPAKLCKGLWVSLLWIHGSLWLALRLAPRNMLFRLEGLQGLQGLMMVLFGFFCPSVRSVAKVVPFCESHRKCMIFLFSCLDLWFYINPAFSWCSACWAKTSHLSYLRLGRWSWWCFDQFHTSSCNFQAISSFMLNILEVSCCWAIRWGVAFPRQKNDVAWTSLRRPSDVVFFYYISYPLSHTSLSDSLFILQYNKPLSKLIHQRLALPPMQLKTQHFL